MRPFKQKNFKDIMLEIKHDFNNDFDAYCINYVRSGKEMLQELDKRIEKEVETENLPLSQFNMLHCLRFVANQLQPNKYYLYLVQIYQYMQMSIYINELLGKHSILEFLSTPDKWKERALVLLQEITDFHEGDIHVFIDEHWSKELSDIKNTEAFLHGMHNTIKKYIGD